MLTGLLLPAPAGAKIYIDISSPERKLPIAISPLNGPMGAEIAKVVSSDLDYTGLFVLLGEKGFSERPYEPFNRDNWLATSVICVMKGNVSLNGEGRLDARVSLYDVQSGKELYRKRYQAPEALIRPIGHAIADDVYRELTGTKSAFRARLAFVTQKHGIRDINLADWDGQRARPIGLMDRLVMTPRWSRDGNSLLYSSERRGRWSVYLLDLKTLREKLIYTGRGTNLAGDIDAQGDIVFSSSAGGNQDIYLYRASDGKVERLTRTSGIDVSPSFSPDGKKIVFISDRSGSPQIYLMDLNGYNTVRLSFKGSYNTCPSWSPQGDRLVFAGRYQGRNQIFTMKPDGSDTVMLTDTGSNEDPAFSPDGRFIVFTSYRDGYSAVYVMRANGEGQKRISPPGVRAFGGRWSPN